MQKLNILLISDYFPPYTVGGAEISAYYLGVGLSKLGHDVTILTRYPRQNHVKYNNFKAVHSVLYRNLRSPFHDYLHTGIFASIDLSKKLEELVKNEEFDIVHAQNWISGYAVMRARHQIKKFPPSILSFRDYRYICPSLYGWCLSDKTKIDCDLLKATQCISKHSNAPYLIKTFGLMPYAMLRYLSCNVLVQSVKAFDAYITNSNFLREVVLNNLGLENDNVHTVYNAVDFEKFEVLKASEDEEKSGRMIKILYVGRFDTGKGIEYLIEAIPHIMRHHDDCSFVFVGGGLVRERLENLARKLNVSKHIIFKGFVPHSDINKYYQQCDIAVVPSVWHEPFGRSLIEAMACGKPVIATTTGGIPEVVTSGKSGLLVEPANSRELANAIITLAENREMRMEMGRTGRKIVEEKYNLDVIARKVLVVYENILDEGE